MKSSPMVSVILSVYNAQAHLRDAIESILNQTYTSFELIAIDDGSYDETPNILKEYESTDDRVRVYRHRNQGLTKSLNRAIALSRGKYLARQDADDISLSQRLEKQVSFLEEHPNCFLVGSNYTEITMDGSEEKKPTSPFCGSDDEIRRGIGFFNPFCHSSVLFRKQSGQFVSGYDESFVYDQDYDLWVRVLKHFQAKNLPEVLVKRRVSPLMISQKNQKAQRYFAMKAKVRAIPLSTGYFDVCRSLCMDLAFIALPRVFVQKLKRLIRDE